MKKFAVISVFLFLSLCLLVCPFSLSQNVAEASGSLPQDTAIIVSENLSDENMTGAVSLQYHIQKITGNKLPIKTDATARTTSYEICFGSTNRTAMSLEEDMPDGSYKIKSFSDGIALIGKGKRGATYAVYEFLRRFAGCEWYTSYVIVGGENIVIPGNVDITYKAYFEYTDTDWSSPCDTEYSLAHGLNGGSRRNISFFEGGSVDYLSGFCHTLSTQFCASEKYFEEHPEYFAYHDGKRVSTQLCLTNPEVVKIVIEEVFDILEDSYEPDAPLQIISLTQNDNEDYCQCENCKKKDEENNAHSGTMITFVNQVAKAVQDAGYQNIAVDTFAYRYTRACPTNVVPLDNVIVRLCTIECCFTHSLDDATCPENVSLMKDLADWGKICDRIYVWDYTTNYAHTCGVFPDFGVIQRNMQIFYENGVKGVYEEGNYYIGSCNTEFGELRSYLLSVLMQDPYCDYSAETDKFLKAFYGDAAPYIREFIDMTIENGAKQHVQIYSSMSETFSFTDEEIAYIDELWDKAVAVYKGKEEENEDNEVYLNRIERSEISWLFWEASCDKGVFAGSGKYQARKELIERINASGTTMLCEGDSTGKISTVMCLFSLDFWQSGDVLFYYIAVVCFFALVLIAALVASVVGIVKKDIFMAFAFPWSIAAVVLFVWGFTLFLSWQNIGLYALSCILTVFAVGYFAFVWYKRKHTDFALPKAVFWSSVHGVVSGAVLQTGVLFLLHGVIFQYRHSHASYCILMMMQAVYILVFLISASVRTLYQKKNKK